MPEPFTKEELPVELSWNFLGAWPDFLIPWGSQDPDATKPVDDGLWVYRRPMAADASEFAVGFEVLPNLVGDFEITLDYRDFKSKAVATDWKIPRIDFSGVVFAADDDFSPMHVLGIAHRRQVDDSLKATATQGKKGPDGNQRWAFKQVVVSRDSGRLRLVRQKTWMFYQTAPPASEDWITIGTWQIDPGVFRSVGFGLRSEDLQGNGEAVLMKLNIRANATKSR